MSKSDQETKPKQTSAEVVESTALLSCFCCGRSFKDKNDASLSQAMGCKMANNEKLLKLTRELIEESLEYMPDYPNPARLLWEEKAKSILR